MEVLYIKLGRLWEGFLIEKSYWDFARESTRASKPTVCFECYTEFVIPPEKEPQCKSQEAKLCLSKFGPTYGDSVQY